MERRRGVEPIDLLARLQSASSYTRHSHQGGIDRARFDHLGEPSGFEADARKLSKKRMPREEVLTAVRNAGGWVSPADLACRLGRPSGTVNRLMWCMARDGELVSDGSGKYAIRRLAA